MTKPTLSLCMIAKDEEVLIGQAIKSVLPIVCEVILVDTGSTDNTVKIAEELGAKILTRPWDDDFSAPRNLSIAEAKGDWILVLDADEAIAERDLPVIQEHILNPENCYTMFQRHYTDDHRLSDYQPAKGEYPEWERHYVGYFASSLVRLFPKHPALTYQNRIHELVEPSIYTSPIHKIVQSPVPIHHYGHTREVKERKNKNPLYGSLGKTKAVENPDDWKAFHELGVEFNRPETREESVLAFKKSIAIYPNYLSSWVNLGYVLCELERYDEAEAALKLALKLSPTSHEAHCNLGVVYLRRKRSKQAEFHFKEAVRLSPIYVNAHLNLVSTLTLENRLSEAVLAVKNLLNIAPNTPQAKLALGQLYKMGAGGISA